MGGFIPERVIEEVKFRNDIVDVIGSYITLKRTGSTYKACCPFHKEKTPSFNVNPQMQIFKCFGCGESGNVISFMMKHQGMDFPTAVKTLAERAGITLELEEDDGKSRHRKMLFEINHEIARFYRRCLQRTSTAKAAREYLQKRGIKDEIAEEFMIGYAPGGWDVSLRWATRHSYSPDQLEAAGLVVRKSGNTEKGGFYDRFRDRLMFPVTDSQGRVVGFSARILINDKKAPKYVNSPETDIFHKGRILYGLDKARRHIVNAPNREALICEGQIDVIRCHQAGIKTALAAQGTAFTPEHARALKNYADSVVLAFDSDAAGRKAAVKTAVIFMDAGIIARIAELPAGEDPDSFILANGATAFRELMESAVSVISFQIRALSREERNANDIAATGRIATAVLHSIAHCDNAVQRARLLQEAADQLNLPQSALDEELQKVQEQIKKDEERRAARDATSASRESKPPTPTAAMQPDTDYDNFGFPLDEADPAEIYDEEPPPGYNFTGETQATVSPPPSAQVPSYEHFLCEHIVHVSDYPEIAVLIDEYLPLEMLKSEKCRRLIEAALAAAKDNNDLLEELLVEGESASDLLEYAEELLSSPVKTCGREYSPAEAVHDIIMHFWRDKLKEERREIIAKGNAADKHDLERRAQISVDLNALRNWEHGKEVIGTERQLQKSHNPNSETH